MWAKDVVGEKNLISFVENNNLSEFNCDPIFWFLIKTNRIYQKRVYNKSCGAGLEESKKCHNIRFLGFSTFVHKRSEILKILSEQKW